MLKHKSEQSLAEELFQNIKDRQTFIEVIKQVIKSKRLYVNKMLYNRNILRDIGYSYTPVLNPASKELARKARDRYTRRQPQVSIIDFPIIEEKSKKRKSSKRCIELFNMSKKVKKGYDKTTEEIEYERYKNELTFTPKINL